ncbi:MAG TPA: hypothetical protein VGZ26_08425, partial [Pirellulales bacterium]|nr:hypothetical protein [Pirellulales bacterium]
MMIHCLRNPCGRAMSCIAAMGCIVAMIAQCAMLAAQDSARPERPEGIRQLDSKHLTLLTDVPSSPEVDDLPAVFDQAFPQWCAYLGVDPER